MSLSVHDLTVAHLSSLAPEDFFLLLAHATGQSREYLIAHPEYQVSARIHTRFLALTNRRQRHEPIAYLTGHKEFYGLDFSVTSATLIPRPETELLVEHIIAEGLKKITDSEKKIIIADIGTGSGCIIISLAVHLRKISAEKFSSFEFCATDISSAALRTARKNSKRHDVDSAIAFHTGDLLAPIRSTLSSADEIIIAANLPYLSSCIYQSSAPDVRDYEPRTALESHTQGLGHILLLLEQISIIRSSKRAIPITLWLEISPEQKHLISAKIQDILPEAELTFIHDLAGRCRFAHIILA